jgi:hypothetical protein
LANLTPLIGICSQKYWANLQLSGQPRNLYARETGVE